MGGADLISDWETKIPHAMQCGQKERQINKVKHRKRMIPANQGTGGYIVEFPL